jgi:hypothetical protein
VTLEDLKSAEQLVKKKQQQAGYAKENNFTEFFPLK